MKKISFILIISNLFLFSCLSLLPKGEGENELHGTSWIFKYGNNLIEYFDFMDGGRYLWRQNLGTAASGYITSENRGTYSIEGNKLILVREGAFSEIRLIATFSDNRQSFSYADRVFNLSTVRRTYSYPNRTLIVENLPSGDFTVGVYAVNSVPKNRNEYRDITNNSFIGGSKGNSPFEITIFASVQVATRLVIIMDDKTSNTKFSIVEFTDSNTTVINWNDMIDYNSLSR